MNQDRATTLMSYLPPVGWADVATKRDLDQLADRFDAIRGEFAAQTRTLLLGMGAVMVSIATLAFAAFHLP